MKIKLNQKTSLLQKTLNICCGTLIILFAAINSFGQAPIISYTSPQTYNVGLAITPLTPANTGGIVTPTAIDVLATGLNKPYGIAVDASKNVYVTDNADSVVYKIPVGGGAPVIIGTGFNHPVGIAVDAGDNIYVCESFNNLVKKIPADGSATISVGSGFIFPTYIAVDKSGNIYVCDKGGVKKMPAGGGTPTLIISAPGRSLSGIAVDKTNNIFYIDGISNQLLEKLFAGGTTKVVAAESHDNLINGVGIDATGNIYYSTTGYDYITKLTAITGEKNKIGSGFNAVDALALDANGRIYVSDNTAENVKRITAGGYYIHPDLPTGLIFDANTGVISGTPTLASPITNYTVTASNHSGTASTVIDIAVTAMTKPAIIYSSPGVYQKNNKITPLVPVNTGGAVNAAKPVVLASGLSSPFGIAVDRLGNIYYTDALHNDVKMIRTGGSAPVSIGTGFKSPAGIAVDGAGNIFVGDGGSSSIKKIAANGSGTTTFVTDEGLNFSAIAADSAGNVYIATGSDNILKFPPTGNQAFVLAFSVNTGGIAVDHAGNVYITGKHTGVITEIMAGTNTVVHLATTGTDMATAAVDALGNVYFAEHTGFTLGMYVASTGKIVTLANGGLGSTYGTALDANGNLYATSLNRREIDKFTTGGYYVDKPLPAGLFIDKATGVISGTPTVTSPATTYNVTAINSGGTSSASFSLAVLANSLLSNLVPSVSNLGPPFRPEKLDYNMTVASSVSSIAFTPTVADAAATLTVNGVTVASGTASAAIPLTTGDNAVHVVVTATDGSKSTYSVLVTRVPSGNYYPATLLTSNGILSPTFTHLTNSYTTQVGAYVASMTVTPTVVDSTATITVNGTPLASGATSAEIPLIVGVNPINIAVTAQNGTVNTYTINVTRVPSTNAYLMRILLNHGYDVPLFSHLIFNYATPVPNGVSAIKVTPIGAVPSSTITVNGAVVASGTASGDIPLTVGVNNISILVTAQDGVTQNTYTVTVTRAPPSLNTVYQPVGVATTNGLNQLNEDGLLVHSGLSPNGDGINDFLLIDGIANYPENKLQIMTRNGQLIFEAKNYDNSNKVFDGHSSKTGQLQLPGTYFYSLDYVVNGVAKHKTGYIVLKY